jgi:hypothetical protein
MSDNLLRYRSEFPILETAIAAGREIVSGRAVAG